MAGAFTNRHINLKKILEGYETLVEAALACGVSANYLSQLKGGKHIGHVMARRLEQGLNLQEGWLDLDHAKLSSQPMNEQQLTIWALKLPNKARIRLLKRLVASLPDKGLNPGRDFGAVVTRTLWIVINRTTNEPVRHLGVHGSREAARAMLDQHLESYDVDLRTIFEVREQDAGESSSN